MEMVVHPNIIHYHWSFMEHEYLVIIMEYIDGGDLSQLISKMKASNKYIAEAELHLIMKGLLQAVEYLHLRWIIHRDIKTPNILLTKTGVVKLADLGVSTVLQNDHLEGQLTRVGTPLYLAPEQVSNQHYSCKIDIWALGCVFFYLCAHRPPFYGNNLLSLSTNICQSPLPSLPNVYSHRINLII